MLTIEKYSQAQLHLRSKYSGLMLYYSVHYPQLTSKELSVLVAAEMRASRRLNYMEVASA